GGLDEAAAVEGVEIFHAGTKAEAGHILANGGRGLNILATGKNVREAQTRAYSTISHIRWAGGFFPHPIRRRRGGRGKYVCFEGALIMTDLADLYPGYELRWIETSGGRIFARVSDSGRAPLLLLHGHPQSNVMWHDAG